MPREKHLFSSVFRRSQLDAKCHFGYGTPRVCYTRQLRAASIERGSRNAITAWCPFPLDLFQYAVHRRELFVVHFERFVMAVELGIGQIPTSPCCSNTTRWMVSMSMRKNLQWIDAVDPVSVECLA